MEIHKPHVVPFSWIPSNFMLKLPKPPLSAPVTAVDLELLLSLSTFLITLPVGFFFSPSSACSRVLWRQNIFPSSVDTKSLLQHSSGPSLIVIHCSIFPPPTNITFEPSGRQTPKGSAFLFQEAEFGYKVSTNNWMQRKFSLIIMWVNAVLWGRGIQL